MGIMNSFPTLDGNQISSDEEEQEQEQEDSDPYIGVAFGSTYWNKGGFRFFLLKICTEGHFLLFHVR